MRLVRPASPTARRALPFVLLVLLLWLRMPTRRTGPDPTTPAELAVGMGTDVMLGDVSLENALKNEVPATPTPTSWCEKRLRLLPRTLRNVTLLASYPGSGNTWMRHLLQRGSRVLTGSAYNDSSLLGEFPGEGRKDGTVIVVKTHYPCLACWTVPSTGTPVTEDQSGKRSYVLSNAALVIVRNPFHAILSEFNRIFSGFNHTGVVSQDEVWAGGPTGLFTTFVRKRAISWQRHTTFYLAKRVSSITTPNGGLLEPWRDENGQLVMAMYFEAFKEAPDRYLPAIFAFLKARRRKELNNLDPVQATSCALSESTGEFKRSKKRSAATRDPFSQVFADPPPMVPPNPTDSWNWRGPTRAIREGETLREMLCRFLAPQWAGHVWGDCLNNDS